MITCPSNGFCFIHVPKTGGTSIRRQIEDLDVYNLKFDSEVSELPEGLFRMAHLPLDILRSNFPDAFEKISTLRRFAVVRRPYDRFFSAVGQHLKETHGKFANEVSDNELADVIEQIVEAIMTSKPYPDFVYAHFIRQTDFVNLDGHLFVDQLYRLDHLSDLMVEISNATGRTLDQSMRLNQSVSFKAKPFKRPLVAAKDLMKQVLPVKTYSKIKDLALPVFTQQGAHQRLLEAADRLRLSGFLDMYYADDIALYRSVPAHSRQTGTQNAH